MTADATHIQVMEVARHRYEVNEPFLFDILDPNINHELSTNKLNGQFVHSQLFMDRLLQVPSTTNGLRELVSSLKQKVNHLTTKNIRDLLKFEQTYSKDQAVCWYTKEEPQLSLHLNRALRERDIDLLFSFRFFIRDIRDQLKHFQYTKAIKVYRAQQMRNYEFQTLKKSKENLIAVNSFFATSTNRYRTVERLGLSQPVESSLERILFEIHLDPGVVTTKSFANIVELSDFASEEEILIMLGSIFRLLDIRPGENEEKNAWIIEMKLCGDNDNELIDIINEIKANNGESDDETSLLLFAHAVRDMGKFDDAKKYYDLALKEQSQDNKKMISRCYHGLGNVADDKGNYEESLELFEQALNILRQISEPDVERQARIYISMGATHCNKDCFEDALNSYDNALSLLKLQSCSNTNYLTAMCYLNKAEVFLLENNYPEALKWYKSTHDICKKYLSEKHDLLGGCYFGFGEIDMNSGQYQNALQNFNTALKIYYKSLTFDHFQVADVMNSIAKTHEMMGGLEQAYLFYVKSGNIYDETLVPTHRKVLENQKNRQRILSLQKQSQHIVNS
jgi:tetratricopeptide (TPR) repeat protein